MTQRHHHFHLAVLLEPFAMLFQPWKSLLRCPQLPCSSVDAPLIGQLDEATAHMVGEKINSQIMASAAGASVDDSNSENKEPIVRLQIGLAPIRRGVGGSFMPASASDQAVASPLLLLPWLRLLRSRTIRQ
ncbi:hypothetical protein ACH5RR_006599 [Cinchona calisaya]|uniref:Uncharacterized protein n=1 Tax=Cinchona calisaya TaxID=153742 RepID=A0ABD3APG1_9GENT